MNKITKSQRLNQKVNSLVQRKVKRAVVKEKRKKNNSKKTWIGKGLRVAGSLAGGFLGNAKLGRSAGAAISKIFGQGDYTMTPGPASTLPPSFGGLNEGYRITHREYLQDIQSSVSFSSTTFFLNPGLATTFPWLSQLAANFEEYEFKGLVFYLKTNSATAVASTNTALGVWGAVTQYDASDPDFTSKRECENYMGCNTAVPCQSVLHAIECKKNANVMSKLFVRDTALDAGDDIKFFDKGKLTVFSQGAQSPSNIGELWVSYDVVFRKPKLPNGGGAIASDLYTISSGISSALPFGGGTTYPIGKLGTYLTSDGKVNFPATIPAGYYMFDVSWETSTANTVATPAVSFSGSMASVSWFGPTLRTYSYAPNGTSNAYLQYRVIARKTDSTVGAINITGPTLPSGCILNAVCTRIPNPFASSTLTKQPKMSLDELTFMRELVDEFKKTQIMKRIEQQTLGEVYEEDEDIRSNKSDSRVTKPKLSKENFRFFQ